MTITGNTNIELSSGIFSGTSAAAPYVAGVAALTEDASSSGLSADELEAALTGTATDIRQPGADPVSGAGRVDPEGAVESVLPENDRFEPNDDLENATTLQPGIYENLQIVAGESDVYAVDLIAGESLSAAARFNHDTGNLNMEVYAPDGTLLETSRTATDNESLNIDTVSQPGTYYVLVSGNQSDSAPYTLSLSKATPETTTAEGAAFSVPESLEDDVEAYRNNVSRDLQTYSFVVATQDELYVVFTDREPRTGAASVNGTVLSGPISSGNLTFGVVSATNASVNTTGTEVSIQEVSENSGQYQRELVRIDAHFRRISTLSDPDTGSNYTLSTTSGVLINDSRNTSALFQEVGNKTSVLSRNASAENIDTILNSSSRSHLHTFSFTTAFWTDAEATVDAIVLGPQSAAQQFIDEYDQPGVAHAEAGEPILYTVQQDLQPRQIADVASIKSQSDSLDGEVVETEVKLYQERISVQETLEHSTDCGVDLLEVQTPQGSVCVNVVQDNLLHGGVAWNSTPQSRDDGLLVVGASSLHQDSPTELRQGRYRIEGEVVPSSRVNESLPDGTVLVIYDLERIGDIDYEATAQESKDIIENQTSELTSQLRQQVGEQDEDMRGPDIVDRFDENDDGEIDNQELLAALAKYDGGAPRQEDSVNSPELLELLAVYSPRT